VKRILLLSLLATTICGKSLTADMLWWNISPTAGSYDTGDYLPGEFVFSVGTFRSGFVPKSHNLWNWGNHFVTSGNPLPQAFWQPYPDHPDFGEVGQEAVFRGGGAVQQGDQAFIWGYNSLDLEPTSQWILLTNPGWIFPRPTPLGDLPGFGPIWGSSDPGTQMLFGTFFNHPQSSDVLQNSLVTRAVPEPSASALIAASGVLALLVVRRCRSKRMLY
jgi:hypothetical protein